MMEDKHAEIKKEILEILNSNKDLNIAMTLLSEKLSNLKPYEDGEIIQLIGSSLVLCAQKLDKPEMAAQFYMMMAKSEILKAGTLAAEYKNLTLGVGWIGFALVSEKKRCEFLDKRITEIIYNTQNYLDEGYKNIKLKPYLGPAGFCYELSGEVYGSVYLLFKLFKMKSGSPWAAKIANLGVSRFLGLDDLLLLDSGIRKITARAKKDSIRCLYEAVRCFKGDGARDRMVDAYISLTTEYRSFNCPFSARIAIFKAERLISRYNLQEKIPKLLELKSASFF